MQLLLLPRLDELLPLDEAILVAMAEALEIPIHEVNGNTSLPDKVDAIKAIVSRVERLSFYDGFVNPWLYTVRTVEELFAELERTAWCLTYYGE